MSYKLSVDVIRRLLTPRNLEENAVKFCAQFNYYAMDFGLDEPLRAAAFIAQAMRETGYLQRLEENLNYRAERIMQVWPNRFKDMIEACQYEMNPKLLASRVYANRMGNGSEYSHDGWVFRGRGLMMLTGRVNYERFLGFLKTQYNMFLNADDVSRYPAAMISAMWFWQDNNLNKFADAGDINAITKRITGGMDDADYRKRLYLRVLQVITTLKEGARI